MIEDMQLRNLTPETQRNYVHHVAGFAKYFGQSPEVLDIEAIRQYQLYLLNERKLSPETINQYISSVKFLYLTTLEMPWTDEYFPHVRRPHKLPVVLSQEEALAFFDNVRPAPRGADDRLRNRSLAVALSSDIDSRG
jgi:site-specific recombinase XerD